MTAACDGARSRVSDKMQRYEQLRARAIEEHRTSTAMASVVVLVRQGMSAWMQLDASQENEPYERSGNVLCRSSLPGAKHSELLTVLTSLVFNVCEKQRELA